MRDVPETEYEAFREEIASLDKERGAQPDSMASPFTHDSPIPLSWLALPHSMYLTNYASPENDKWGRSVSVLTVELVRANKLGLHMVNIHPGSTLKKCSEHQGLLRVARAINRAHADPATGSVMVVLENSAHSQGTGSVGYSFEHLATIIRNVKQKKRVGVCLDLCHLFSAGVDIRTQEAFAQRMAEFDRIVGLKYLVALHCNDSVDPFDCSRDHHAVPLTGTMGPEVWFLS